MKNQEIMKIVYSSYVVSIIGSFILSFIKSNSILANTVLSSVKVSTVLSIWWLFYFNVGWKIPLLNKYMFRINLNGTWFGNYTSANPDSDTPYEGEISIRIKQDFLNLSIISRTQKYSNYSYSEELKYDSKSDVHGIVYVYSQKEKNSLDLNQRNGTAELKVLSKGKSLSLEGEFWTIHGTKGMLQVSRVSKNRVDTFEEAKSLNQIYYGGIK